MEYDTSSSASNQEGKAIAMVSYITLIGWVVALILHNGRKTSLGAFHLRQSLGLMILVIATMILQFPLLAIPLLGWLLYWALLTGILVLWLVGLIHAAGGQERPVPIVGGQFQKWFAGFAL